MNSRIGNSSPRTSINNDIPKRVSYIPRKRISNKVSTKFLQKKSRKKIISNEDLGDYAAAATMHGIAYVFESNVHSISRVCWFIIVCTLMALGAIMIATLLNDWSKSPVLTTVDDTSLSISQIEYPAITICGQGSIENAIEKAFGRLIRKVVINRTELNL